MAREGAAALPALEVEIIPLAPIVVAPEIAFEPIAMLPDIVPPASGRYDVELKALLPSAPPAPLDVIADPAPMVTDVAALTVVNFPVLAVVPPMAGGEAR